nr:unnamed protein product [Spirometra erinaceieuropaei]
MASFGVASLFTSIPQDLAIETIELLLQNKYDERENRLGRAQVLQLLKFCLRTYFTFDGTIYEQVKGTPIGLPISGFIADTVLQRFESLVFQHYKPKFSARYVDDTFVVIDWDQLLTFKERLNAVFPDIQFTMEEEENNQLAFLCGQSNYVGETGRQLQTRMAEHAAAVLRNDVSSQVAAHSTGSGHTFKFDEAEIPARGDNRVSRELLESWFTGPQSINKCNDLPIQYSVLRLRLGGVISHAGSAQVNTLPNARVGASDGRAIITPTSNARDEIEAINDANVGHHATCNDP